MEVEAPYGSASANVSWLVRAPTCGYYPVRNRAAASSMKRTIRARSASADPCATIAEPVSTAPDQPVVCHAPVSSGGSGVVGAGKGLTQKYGSAYESSPGESPIPIVSGHAPAGSLTSVAMSK
jgi:hypothetical protein